MTDEPPQHALDEEEPDDIELPQLETQVPVLCQSKEFLYHHLTYAMNI